MIGYTLIGHDVPRIIVSSSEDAQDLPANARDGTMVILRGEDDGEIVEELVAVSWKGEWLETSSQSDDDGGES